MITAVYKKMRPFILLLFIFLSCINKTHKKDLSAQQLDVFRDEFNLPKEKTFRIDRSYLAYLFSFDTIRYSVQIQNHYQPVQAVYYDKTGNQISYHTNCYAAEGNSNSPVFNWNRQNAFNSFVPKTVAPLDSILSLHKHLSFIKSFNNKPIDTTGFSSNDFIIIVHWSKKLYPEGSKMLIKTINDNLDLVTDKRINIIYVNNDDLW
jgi:hypothetical protein